MPDDQSMEAPREGEVVYGWISRTREVMVLRHAGKLRALSAICPHMGARLRADFRAGAAVCPWHGLSFSLEDGRCAHPRYPRLKVLEAACADGKVRIGPDAAG